MGFKKSIRKSWFAAEPKSFLKLISEYGWIYFGRTGWISCEIWKRRVESKELLAHGQWRSQNLISRAPHRVRAAARSTFHFAGHVIVQTRFHYILHQNWLAGHPKISSKPCAVLYNQSNNKNPGLDGTGNPCHWRDCARDWQRKPRRSFSASFYARLRAALCETRWTNSQLRCPLRIRNNEDAGK